VLIALLLAFFLGFNLVAQFKAGGVIVQVMLEGQPAFEAAAGGMEWWARTFSFLSGANQPSSQYCLGLLLFAFGVVIYTAYGGFRAVVWTDVLQGVVMLAGVLILLPLAIWKAGGLETATQDLASRVTPRVGEVSLALEGGASEPVTLPADSPIRLERDGRTHAFRTVGAVELLPGAAAAAIAVRAEAPEELPAAAWSSADPEAGRAIIEGAEAPRLRVEAFRVSGRRSLASGPGPSASSLDGFLPLGLALSFFVMWAITGAGQPGTLVRLMAFRDARVFRRAIFVATIYYSLIYIPLVVIFVCARSVLPDLAEPDQAMPAMVTFVAPGVLAGILLAAPFAAVMSTVDSFLLIISSNLVRDVYQRTFRPNASSRRIRIGSYLTTVVVGVLVTVAATNPPRFLQDLIVFSTAGMACSFLAPMLMAMYWKRSTAAGIYASILAGFLTIVGLYGVNWVLAASVGPYNFAGVLPAVWGLLVSAAAGVVVSLLTRPPRRELVDLYFSARRPPQQRCG
jgi:Na+/pantothenate symporter